MSTLFFDIVTSVPYTSISRLNGQRTHPAQLLQVALLDANGELLFKSYVQPADLNWQETSDGTYLPVSLFKRKRFPTQQQVISNLKPYLTGFEVVVFGLIEKWAFVHPFISPIRQKWCSKQSALSRSTRWSQPTEIKFEQAIGEILQMPAYSPDNGLLDAQSVATGSRALWLYATDRHFQKEIEDKREYYLIKPIVDQLIYKEREPMYRAWAKRYETIETRLFTAAGIFLPDWDRKHNNEQSANTFCLELTGHSLYFWEKYGTWLDVPTIPAPYDNQLIPDYRIKQFKRMQPVFKVDNQLYQTGGNRFTFLFDLTTYQIGLDYVPIVDYPPKGSYSLSRLKKEFKLTKEQLNSLVPIAQAHGEWGEYLLYKWPA